jgi:hypothetical protein
VLHRQQLLREMQVAQELQLKLLPSPAVVGPEARAATRMVPAESVGGDFFLLARLDADRTGVLIGDVSGHGYQAALVMALALSAAGGISGVLLGMSIVKILDIALPDVPVQMAWAYIVMAFIVAILIGMVAGVAPAMKSARLEPLEALRTE